MDRTCRAIRRALLREATRPLCLIGPSGSGKTWRLRETLQAAGPEARWTTARDTVDGVVEALRAGWYDNWREAFTSDPRPLVIEHVEDLRGRHRTMEELRCILGLRRSRGHASILTLTLEPQLEGVVEAGPAEAGIAAPPSGGSQGRS